MYDVDQFTAIINPPDSGILAIGSIEDKAVVKDGQVVPGKRMRVTLSVDHRVFYGVTAAEFLREVKRPLQSPMALARQARIGACVPLRPSPASPVSERLASLVPPFVPHR